MSHFEKRKTSFRNVEALSQACAFLNLTLSSKEKARGWNGNKLKADYVIKLPGKYDVAVQKIGDEYDIEADWFDGSVERIIGKDGNLLKQAYNAAVAVQVAKEQGHPIVMTKGQAGEIKLVMKVGVSA